MSEQTNIARRRLEHDRAAHPVAFELCAEIRKQVRVYSRVFMFLLIPFGIASILGMAAGGRDLPYVLFGVLVFGFALLLGIPTLIRVLIVGCCFYQYSLGGMVKSIFILSAGLGMVASGKNGMQTLGSGLLLCLFVYLVYRIDAQDPTGSNQCPDFILEQEQKSVK